MVLFSHHQPFTQLDTNKGGNLLDQLESYHLADKIFAWYWGHEHRCLMYDPHPEHQFHGRCVGHAAFPEERPSLSTVRVSPAFGDKWRGLDAKPAKGGQRLSPAAWIYDDKNIYVPAEFQAQFSPNGYMRLEFSDDKLVEYVRTPDGTTIWQGELKPTQ